MGSPALQADSLLAELPWHDITFIEKFCWEGNVVTFFCKGPLCIACAWVLR